MKKVDLTILIISAILLILLCVYYNMSNRIKVNEVSISVEDSYTDDQKDTMTIYVVNNMSGDFYYEDHSLAWLPKVPRNGIGLIYDMQSHRDSAARIKKIPVDGLSLTGNNTPFDLSYIDAILSFRSLAFRTEIKLARRPRCVQKGQCVLDPSVVSQIDERLEDGVLYLDYFVELYDYEREVDKVTAYSIPAGNIGKFFNQNISAINLKSVKGVLPEKTRIVFMYQTAMAFDALGLEPDQRLPSMIVYDSPDKIRAICEKGLFVYGHSLSNSRKQDTINFILAALLGLLISVVFDSARRMKIGK